MELSKCSYIDILNMPVLDLRKYLEWKIKFDSDREKQRADALSRIKKPKRKK